MKRGAFSEAEVRQLLADARPYERALIAPLCFTGARPGEVFALDWSAVDLDAGHLRIERSWDHRGRKFVEPKTKAGNRIVPLSSWLVGELKAHRERSGGTGLVFPNRVGKPLHPSNVARRVWQPLRKRAGVSEFDMYQVYAHSLQSGMASAVENVTARALGVKPQLRLIDGGRGTLDVSLDEGSAESHRDAQPLDSKAS